ncbi:cell wall metabolism sensor histidine kinase WalK [Paenibacillus sp. OV219]|uniref:sensor histidine kinase n=1 Tax=Paenibacillus sp. OV219 TaxID=1884377 RepID=UPI0008B04A8E|nr:HAMP domain-containing sensor histidine kinase [Paenibacillus sp. OV219]SEN36580.1 Signal transduction histidine kinase [Paenibacillus sp. OV219]
MDMPLWKRILAGLAGMILMNIAIYTTFTIAYTAVSYYKEKHNQSALTAELVHDGQLIADILTSKPSSEWKDALLPAASSNGYRIVLVDAKGKVETFGDAEKAGSLPSQEATAAVLERGEKVELLKRSNPFVKGTALAGMKVSRGGQQYALFIQEEAPSLYRGLPQQLFTVFLGFLLLFIILLLIGRPWRHRDGARVYINAIRRMSKGDFSVSIAKSEQIPQFGELAASINDMAAELSQLEQMRQTFISNVSHEIQSPLTSIRGFAKALQHEGIDDEQRNHYASIIENESTRLSKLSDNLLKLTTLEARDEPIRLKPLRLDQQVRSMILACEPLWMDKNIVMDVGLDEEVTILGDDELLSQVWMNILANSMKFTPEGGTVSVEVKQTAGGASVSITDTGIGISEEDLPHIFERFFKADRSRNRKLGGSGLGLSIVKRIVDMHNGTVTASSKADAGTTITVTLPSGPPQLPAKK